MELETYLKKTADEVNSLLQDWYGDPKSPLSQAANHLLFAGGKRLRPALFKLAADSVTPGSSHRIMPAGLSLEVTHNFTLIHDDIMDKDEYRRGQKTVHTLWGEPVAILAGDVLYARAFSLICHAEAPGDAKVRAVSLLARTCEEICEGQQQDMSFEERNDVTRDEYLAMVTRKTGVLYGAAAAIGSLLAGGSDEQVDALYNYGCKIGAAFQIQDDLIDLLASPEKSGKDQASDIREGKQTLIAITARKKGIDLQPWRRSLTRDDIASLIALLRDKGVIDSVRRDAEEMIGSAISGLHVLTDTPEKKLLADLAWYFIKRDY
ncbi:MAG TPA: polyprenyl synthetase family protein [Methanospirillum sp.]|uniref:polyprenyl synthetase family protein n=1 Tax=Methanospirillum sp. TaxID=45200 RepID=UPI002D06D678|nr:polyprenyl synthetase family protein [Methanospirillum sp.]HOJ97386.1 polyprenyl synthetase family protein [Methanospirillum sp.]HOL41220.1 polyprenyl synthetase family protein [Methanospirillum sp.]HPP78541.1 polyprenyl synthetase family protein [Methanospirillum sp.]